MKLRQKSLPKGERDWRFFMGHKSPARDGGNDGQAARTVGSQIGRQILRGVLGGILGGSRRR